MRAELFAFEFRRNFGGLLLQTFAQHLAILRIAQESFFAADALDVVAEFQRAIIFAKCKLLEPQRKGADEHTQIAGIILHVANRLNPRAIQFLFSNFADAMNRSNRQWPQKFHLLALSQKRQPIRLLEIARDLREQLVRGDPDARSQSPFSSDSSFQVASN